MSYSVNETMRSDTPDGLETQFNVISGTQLLRLEKEATESRDIPSRDPSLSPALLTCKSDLMDQNQFGSSVGESSVTLVSPELSGPIKPTHVSKPLLTIHNEPFRPSTTKVVNEPRKTQPLSESQSFGSIILGMLSRNEETKTSLQRDTTIVPSVSRDSETVHQTHVCSSSSSSKSQMKCASQLQDTHFMAYFHAVKKDLDRNLEAAVQSIQSSVSQLTSHAIAAQEKVEEEKEGFLTMLRGQVLTKMKAVAEDTSIRLQIMEETLKQNETHLRLVENQNTTILSQQAETMKLLHLLLNQGSQVQSHDDILKALLENQQSHPAPRPGVPENLQALNMVTTSTSVGSFSGRAAPVPTSSTSTHEKQPQVTNELSELQSQPHSSLEDTQRIRELRLSDTNNGSTRPRNGSGSAPRIIDDLLSSSPRAGPNVVPNDANILRHMGSFDETLFEPPSETSSQLPVSEVPNNHSLLVENMLVAQKRTEQVNHQEPQVFDRPRKKPKRGKKRKARW